MHVYAAERMGRKMKTWRNSLRVAVTGQGVGWDFTIALFILGRDARRSRIGQTLEMLRQQDQA